MLKTTHVERLTAGIDRASDVACYVAIAANYLLCLLIISEVLMRTFFNTSLLITGQASEWLLVTMVFTGAAWTLKKGGHVRINLITNCFPERSQQWSSVLLMGFGALVCGWCSIYAFMALAEAYLGHYTGHSVYRLPKWWVWTFFSIGLSLVALQFISMALDGLVRIKSRLYQAESKKEILPWIITAVIIAFCLISVLWSPARGMHPGLILLIIIAVVFSLIGSSMWIFVSLSLTGVFGLLVFTNYSPGFMAVQVAFSTNESFVLTCLPLFVLMGELLFRSGASNDLYSGIAPLVERIPGRLLHSNILSCTVFAAISGSSAVTCATIGTVAIPELRKRGYHEGLVLGSLAGAGTLGLLIPPSIVLIIYGAVTAQSIGQLFLAGILPGLFLSGLFMLYIMIICILKPSIRPPAQNYKLHEKVKRILRIIPIVVVIVMVLGLIYLGITTPTEAGAIGVLSAAIVTLLYGNLSKKVIMDASFATIKTTCMIMFIVTGAAILSSAMAYLRVPQQLAMSLETAPLSKYFLFFIICVIYLGLGCLFDGVSLMVLTLPVVFPIIKTLGFDPIWFGIVLTILIETAQITPPVGFNLYVLQNISGRSIGRIVYGTIPFFLIMLMMVVILTIFPNIALILPNLMIGAG